MAYLRHVDFVLLPTACLVVPFSATNPLKFFVFWPGRLVPSSTGSLVSYGPPKKRLVQPPSSVPRKASTSAFFPAVLNLTSLPSVLSTLGCSAGLLYFIRQKPSGLVHLPHLYPPPQVGALLGRQLDVGQVLSRGGSRILTCQVGRRSLVAFAISGCSGVFSTWLFLEIPFGFSFLRVLSARRVCITFGGVLWPSDFALGLSRSGVPGSPRLTAFAALPFLPHLGRADGARRRFAFGTPSQFHQTCGLSQCSVGGGCFSRAC